MGDDRSETEPVDEEIDADALDPEEVDEIVGSDGRLSGLTSTRRTLMSGLAGLGVIGVLSGEAGATGSSTTTAVGDTVKVGNSYFATDAPENHALQLDAAGSTQYGIRATTDKDNGRALQGNAQNSTGFNVAVNGVTASENGTAVQGYAFESGSNSENRGVYGRAAGGKGRGVVGKAEASEGFTYGVYGTTNSPNGNGVFGSSSPTTGQTIGIRGRSRATQGTGVQGEVTQGSGVNYGVLGKTSSPDGFGIYTPDDGKIEGSLEVVSDLVVQGTKDFAHPVQTPSGTKHVRYTAVEAGKAHTEISDVADVEDGRTEIELPEHFQMVTSEVEDLTVQLTPYAREQVHPQVVQRSLDRIVVEDFGDGPDDYAVAYTIKGVREGFEDQETIQG